MFILKIKIKPLLSWGTDVSTFPPQVSRPYWLAVYMLVHFFSETWMNISMICLMLFVLRHKAVLKIMTLWSRSILRDIWESVFWAVVLSLAQNLFLFLLQIVYWLFYWQIYGQEGSSLPTSHFSYIKNNKNHNRVWV